MLWLTGISGAERKSPKLMSYFKSAPSMKKSLVMGSHSTMYDSIDTDR